MSILIKSELELHYMQEVASIATEVHRQIRNLIAPGVTTAQLERAAADVTVHNGAFPASMGYRYGGGGGGFPGCACFDVNNQVTNCIATDVSLKDGDIVGITVIIRKGNFFAKRHVTYPVGHVSDNVLKLLKTVEEALYCGIAASEAEIISVTSATLYSSILKKMDFLSSGNIRDMELGITYMRIR